MNRPDVRMAVLAVVTCPCHLPVLLALLGGTAVGAALSDHIAVTFVAVTVLFVLSAWTAWRMFESWPPGKER